MDRVTTYIAAWSGTNKEWLDEAVGSVREQGVEPVVEYSEGSVRDRWNKAIECCNTEFLHIFSHDDTLLPGFYKEAVGWLDSHPDASAVFTLDVITDESGTRIGQTVLPFPSQDEYGFKFIFDSMLRHGNFLRCPSVVFRVDKVRGLKYPEECGTADDTAMWFQALTRGDIGIIPKPLYVYRQASTSDTQKNVIGSPKVYDHILAIDYAARLRPHLVDYLQRIAIAKGLEERENAIEAKRLEARAGAATEVEFYVVHEPPFNAGTGVLVGSRVQLRNREDTGLITFYVCPSEQGTSPTPHVIKGVPTLFCHPNGFQQLVDKYRPALISYQHLLRWPLGILGVGTDARRELYLHDSYLWCALWHSFDGKKVCNEPEDEKCARCAGVPVQAIRGKREELKKYLPGIPRIVSNSAYTATYCEKWLGVRSEIEEPSPPELPYYRKRKVFGYFGGFYPVKGIGTLLEAWGEILWGQLLMFCDVPPEMLKGRSMYGHENVLVMGRYEREDLPRLLNLVDCVIAPSMNESYGLVKRECEALGKKVIATETGGMGGTIPPGDVNALVDVIQVVIGEEVSRCG